MSPPLSPNTQAILLLTAPLIMERGERSPELLTQSEYNKLARFLREKQRQPAEFLTSHAEELLRECEHLISSSRLKRLLARGFSLSQVVERWQARALWIISRADSAYPPRLKDRLKNDAPPILYGCGDDLILNTGGLAVVGSRHVNEPLVEYTKDIGRLTARSGHTVISGGARGIDHAAMRGALDAGGKVAGILADSLDRAALNRENRGPLMDGQLVLISPFDPAAGFNVGNAMKRNKLIYGLADAALVVSSDYEQGGTWTGAVEQLEKLKLLTVYVRSTGQIEKGLEALERRGAVSWPNPDTPEKFAEALSVTRNRVEVGISQSELPLQIHEAPAQAYRAIAASPPVQTASTAAAGAASLTAGEELFAKVRELAERIAVPKSDAEIASDLAVSKSQAKAWLQRLVEEGVLERLERPVRYRKVTPARQGTFTSIQDFQPTKG